VPALQAGSPEVKSQSYPKTKKIKLSDPPKQIHLGCTRNGGWELLEHLATGRKLRYESFAALWKDLEKYKFF
jgi:hypothetical protein